MKLSAPTKDGLNEDLKNGFELAQQEFWLFRPIFLQIFLQIFFQIFTQIFAQNSLQLELPYSLSLTV